MESNLIDSSESSRIVTQRYLAVLAATPFLLLGLVLCAMLRLAQLGPTNHTSETICNVYCFDHHKQKIATQVQGKRVFLLGGSGVFYSVRAKELQSRLGVAVINDGLHVGLGIDYLLYRAQQHLRTGDTVVLELEYANYFSTAPTRITADYVLPYDLKYFFSQPLKNQFAMLHQLTPTEYGLRIYDAVFSKAINQEKFLGNINNNGDLTANTLASQSDKYRAALNKFQPIKNASLGQDSARLISEFVKWCKEHDVKVIAGYPAAMNFPEYHVGNEANFFNSLNSFYHSLDVVTLGEPFDYMFPKSMFYDTPYHLHDVGAVAMTELLVTRLQPLLNK